MKPSRRYHEMASSKTPCNDMVFSENLTAQIFPGGELSPSRCRFELLRLGFGFPYLCN